MYQGAKSIDFYLIKEYIYPGKPTQQLQARQVPRTAEPHRVQAASLLGPPLPLKSRQEPEQQSKQEFESNQEPMPGRQPLPRYLNSFPGYFKNLLQPVSVLPVSILDVFISCTEGFFSFVFWDILNIINSFDFSFAANNAPMFKANIMLNNKRNFIVSLEFLNVKLMFIFIFWI